MYICTINPSSKTTHTMKRVLCLCLVLVISAMTIQAQPTPDQEEEKRVMPVWPKCENYKASVPYFRAWFNKEYDRQLDLYRKEHKDLYKAQRRDLQDCMARIIIDKTGHMTLDSTKPATICEMQRTVIINALREAPVWQPATIGDRAVNFPIILPISHSAEYENIHKYPGRTE